MLFRSAFSILCIIVGNWYGAIANGITLGFSIFEAYKATHSNATRLYWRETRTENKKAEGIYNSYFKLRRTFYLDSAHKIPLEINGVQQKETLYAMRSINY